VKPSSGGSDLHPSPVLQNLCEICALIERSTVAHFIYKGEQHTKVVKSLLHLAVPFFSLHDTHKHSAQHNWVVRLEVVGLLHKKEEGDQRFLRPPKQEA